MPICRPLQTGRTPETELGCDVGYTRDGRVGFFQRAARQVHAAERQVALQAHAEMFLKAVATVRPDTPALRSFRHINWFVGVALQECTGFAHQGAVATSCAAFSVAFRRRQTGHHSLSKACSIPLAARHEPKVLAQMLPSGQSLHGSSRSRRIAAGDGITLTGLRGAARS